MQEPAVRGLKLLLVDGFAGGGVDSDGAPGSPVILLRTLYETAAEINARRVESGPSTLTVNCTLLLNDIDIVQSRSYDSRWPTHRGACRKTRV